MSYNLEKLIIGGFLSFAEGGTTIDSLTIDSSAYPDNDPVENWSPLGCISEVNFETETETDTDYCPSPTGGYDKNDDEVISKDLIKFVTKDHSEPFWRLLMGTPAAIVDDATQVPFSEPRRYVEGWLKIQGVGDDGNDRIMLHVWGRLSIDSNPKWSKDATKPALKFQKFFSSASTILPTGIN